jgi:hypothetical protein
MLQQALSSALRKDPVPSSPSLLVAGATGVMGNEVLRRLVGTRRFGAAHVLAKRAMRAGLPGVHLLELPGDEPQAWPPLAVKTDVAVVMFDPPRAHYGRERALWTPQPSQLPALATWLHAGGVRTLAIVLPHDQGRLPDAVKHGLANLDEQAVASMGFERLLLVRSARKPGGLPGDASAPQKLAAWMLSIFQYMLPTSEQPVRAAKVAELLDLALQMAPPGIHVAAPQTVWQAAQGDAAAVLGRWLNGAGPGMTGQSTAESAP